MKVSSKDLQVRVIDAVDRGMPRAEVTEQFQVSPRTINAGCSAAAPWAPWQSRPGQGRPPDGTIAG